LYKNSPDCSILSNADGFDEGLQGVAVSTRETVERTIGAKERHRRIAGCAFLKESLFRRFFHDLWAIGTAFDLLSFRAKWRKTVCKNLSVALHGIFDSASAFASG